jgi:hypothetical protein
MCHYKVILLSYRIKGEAQQNKIHSLAYNAGLALSMQGAAKPPEFF